MILYVRILVECRCVCVSVCVWIYILYKPIYLSNTMQTGTHTGRTSTCSDMFWFRILMISALGPCSLFLLSGFFSFFFLSHPGNQRTKCEPFYQDSYCCQLNIQTELSFAFFCNIKNAKEHELTMHYTYKCLSKQFTKLLHSTWCLILIPCGSMATACPVTQNFLQVKE